MPAYIIVEVAIRNKEKYEEYREFTPATVEAYGGKFVTRGNPVTVLEGSWDHDRLVSWSFLRQYWLGTGTIRPNIRRQDPSVWR